MITILSLIAALSAHAQEKSLFTEAMLTAAAPVHVAARGQSFLICESADTSSTSVAAVTALNARFNGGLATVKTTIGGTVNQIDAPYSISAPAITSYSREVPDAACVTITKL